MSMPFATMASSTNAHKASRSFRFDYRIVEIFVDFVERNNECFDTQHHSRVVIHDEEDWFKDATNSLRSTSVLSINASGKSFSI